MTDPTRDDPASYPALGRALMALGRPGAGARVTWALGAVCFVLLAADFLYHKHVYLAVEEVHGFYPFVGFVGGAALVIVALAARALLQRREDLYAPHDTETEAWPEDQLGKDGHDG